MKKTAQGNASLEKVLKLEVFNKNGQFAPLNEDHPPEIKNNDVFFGDAFIYLLVHEDNIVYVGRTRGILSRLKFHRKNKNFSKVYYLRTRTFDSSGIESSILRFVKPKYNIHAGEGFMKCHLSILNKVRLSHLFSGAI